MSTPVRYTERYTEMRKGYCQEHRGAVAAASGASAVRTGAAARPKSKLPTLSTW